MACEASVRVRVSKLGRRKVFHALHGALLLQRGTTCRLLDLGCLMSEPSQQGKTARSHQAVMQTAQKPWNLAMSGERSPARVANFTSDALASRSDAQPSAWCLDDDPGCCGSCSARLKISCMRARGNLLSSRNNGHGPRGTCASDRRRAWKVTGIEDTERTNKALRQPDLSADWSAQR